MKEDICKLLNIKYPILQGAMAWISDSSLAAAVSNTGGIGIIAGGNAPAEYIREEIKKCKKLTDKPFGLNIMLLSEDAPKLAKIAVEEGVEVITTGAGNPGKYMDMWKEAGIKVIPVVPSVALAKRMERLGADAIIAEGCESGGHIGKLTTMALVPHECTIHENYKEAVIKANDIDTVVTGRSTGHPVQVIKNKLARQFMNLESNNAPVEELEKLGRGALPKAARDGDVELGSVMAGQISGLVNKRESVKEIIEDLFQEYDKVKNYFNN